MFDFDGDSIAAAAAASPAFAIRARYWTADVVFGMGDEAYRLEMRDGVVARFARDSSGAPANVLVSGPAEAWEKLLSAVPPPGADDPLITGLRSGLSVRGEVAREVAPYYPAIQEFIAVLRGAHSGPSPVRAVPDVQRKFDAAVGRYIYVTLGGVQHRIYFEEAGHGPVPLLLQHTASAEGSQWRFLLEDPDFQRMFRMIAYDLPYHGKSLPPTSVRWWEQDYKLTKARLIETVLAISGGLELDRPVYMGCSVGGFLAPDLALACPEAFRAIVGINAGLGIDPARWHDEIENTYLNPRVGDVWKGAVNVGLTAPTSPEALRREVGWVYSKSAPQAMWGDIYYYAHDHDLTEEQARSIDTSRTPLYLLTCEYDVLATDDGTARLARAIPGAKFQIIPGLGHFGPAENPEDFKAALAPVFEEIAGLP